MKQNYKRSKANKILNDNSKNKLNDSLRKLKSNRKVRRLVLRLKKRNF